MKKSQVDAVVGEFVIGFAPGGIILRPNPRFESQNFDVISNELWQAIDRIEFNLPDIVIFQSAVRRLFLVELSSGNGPITKLRKSQLSKLFGKIILKKHYISVFWNREDLRVNFYKLSYNTSAWLVDSPDHLIVLS